jgi:glycosyltransferase involved in cell wall biosynthesis
MKILINASNLHVGGGVQVAVSFISELYNLGTFDVSIICSSTVFKNLPSYINFQKFNSFTINNVYGFSILTKKQKNLFSGYDICFTIFGPFYNNIKVSKHICGFAQAWIAYPNNVAYKFLPFISRYKNRIKFFIQSLFFKRYDFLIVEQQHVRESLIKIGFKEDKISVVDNCISGIFEDEYCWQKVIFPKLDKARSENRTIGFIGRAYSHKNVAILKEVNDILKEKYLISFNFIFTFSEQEMKNLGFDKLDNFFSVGEININQCPSFYNQIDALIFPSLLECFSVSPLEAMKMKTPVIASEYVFVKELCKDFAFYFNPLEPLSIASSIVDCFSNDDIRNGKVTGAFNLVNSLPSATDRVRSTMKIIEEIC